MTGAAASAHDRRKAATRENIVEEAFAMVCDQPGAPFSHEAIAVRTGIAARTIYRHFPTRADLTGALWIRMRERLAPEWPESEDAIGPAVRRLFTQFERHEGLAHAAITAAASTGYPIHGSAEGRAAFGRSLAGLLEQLPAHEAEQVVAACVAVYSAPFWQMLRERGQLSNKAAGDTAAWVIDAIIASARRRAKTSPTAEEVATAHATRRTLSRSRTRRRPHPRPAQRRR